MSKTAITPFSLDQGIEDWFDENIANGHSEDELSQFLSDWADEGGTQTYGVHAFHDDGEDDPDDDMFSSK